jgi:hypothetical protein
MKPIQFTRRLAVLFGLIACLLPAASGLAKNEGEASDTLQDYRYRMELSLSGQQGAYRLTLPQAVYLHARSANLDDLRVFDANGAKIPFSRLLPTPQASVQRGSVAVKIFPVYFPAHFPANANQTTNTNENGSGGMALDIQTRADGSVISVRTQSGDTKSTNKLQTLVLDLQSALPQTTGANGNDPTLIEALRFTLPAGQTTYSAQIWLEASDDLQNWDAIGTAQLNWLVNSDEQTLASDRLEFEARRFRYARISWRKGEPLAFATINAETVLPIAAAAVYERLVIPAVPGKNAGDLAYTSAPAIPVESISLQFNEPNVVFPAAIGHYVELPAKQIGQAVKWRFQAQSQATFYQITQNGQLRSSGEIKLASTPHQSEWVLRPAQASSIKPALRLSWQPASLIFVAGGKPPYTLAFGREKASPAALELSQVAPGFSMNELQKLEAAKPGALQQQTQTSANGESEAAIASASAKNRTLVLWGVLLLGLAILGAMVWRLVKQMKQVKPE